MIWDKESKTIRGSFVNLIITVSILILITYGALFSKDVCDRLISMTSLIIGFFTASFGIWDAKMLWRVRKANNNF